jgi:phosphatidylinositol-bisphosphatase
MSYWFLVSATLLLQSTSLFHSVQAIQRPWKTVLPTTITGVIRYPTIIENRQNNGDAAAFSSKHSRHDIISSSSVLLRRVLTLRAGGEVLDDVDYNATNSRRRRRRKRKSVLKRQEEGRHSSKKEELIADNDDAAVVATSSTQPNVDPTKKKGRRKRRRLFSTNDKVEDVTDIEIELDIKHQEDFVATTVPSNETGKRKKKRRKKVVGEKTNEGDLEQEIELDTVPQNIKVVIAEDIIPQTGEVSANDNDASPEDLNNTEAEAATRMKKRKRKKRGTEKIVQDTAADDKEEETPSNADTTPLPSIGESVDSPSEETSRPKKRKRKKRVSSQTVQDISGDVLTEKEMPEAFDTTPLRSIDASIVIPSEEIVPESTGSYIEVDNSLKVAPMEDAEVQDPSLSVDVVHPVDEEVESASDDEKSITIIDASTGKESDVESIVGLIDDEESDADEMIAQSEETVHDVIEHVAIDVAVEIPEEEIVPESIGASIEVKEDFRADASVVDADDCFNDMNVLVNSGEDEEENEESLKETNVIVDASIDISDEETIPDSTINSFDEGESETPISEESATSSEDNSISVEEVIAKDTDDGITKDTDDDDDDGSDENEENESVEQSTAPLEVSEASIRSSNEEEALEDGSSADAEETEAGDQTTHGNEIETEEIVAGQEAELYDDQPSSQVNGPSTQFNEEEGVVQEEAPSAQDEESIDLGTITEKETETDQTLQDSIELEKMKDDCLTISVVTWNLGEAAFSEKEASFFKMFRKGDSRIGSDLVLIGAQECEDIKPRRTEGHRSRHLRRVGIQMLGKEYVPLAIHSLGGIQLALYCHRDVLGDVDMVNIADVTCGVGNVFHNKGAIGVYLQMRRLSGKNNGVVKTSRMLFATAHLAAHVKNVDARNDDFKRIISGLEAQAPARFLRPKRNPDGSPSECDGSYLLKSMDHIFFAGDLNYRVDLPREYVEQCIIDIKHNQACGKIEEADELMNKLLRRDQLLQTIASGRAFSQFNEGKITFLPTFKFDKGTQNYDTSHKQRVPAWTDRILFRSSKVNVLEYQSVPAANHSDHRPVFGIYQLDWGLATKVASKEGKRGRRSRKK